MDADPPSVHTATRWRTRQAAHREAARADVYLIGSYSSPPEPQLMAALAADAQVGSVYFIPVHATHRDAQKVPAILDNRLALSNAELPRHKGTRILKLAAYDLTEALRAAPQAIGDPQAAQRIVHDALHAAPPQMLSLREDAVFISRHNELRQDMAFKNVFPHACFLNDPTQTERINNKLFLPEIAREMHASHPQATLFARMRRVTSAQEAEAFMAETGSDQIVLKDGNSMGGLGVYRIFRDPDTQQFMCCSSGEPFPLARLRVPPNGLLAMEWLDARQAGDMRVILINGECVGGYKRLPTTDWRANGARGGRIEPVHWETDLNAADRGALKAVAEALRERYGQGWVSVDLLANAHGQRFISEFNIGQTDDFCVGGHSPLQPERHAAEHAARAIVAHYHSHQQSAETIRTP